MSILRRHASCPRCGNRAEHPVVRSIDAERSPHLVEDLLQERLQRFTCAACGEHYVVEAPFAYVDFTRGLWIAHFPREWEEDWRDLEADAADSFRQAMAEEVPGVVRELAAGLRVRAVFGLGQLLDKVLCLGAGIDDRLLEVLKLDLLRATPGLPFSLAARPTLVRIEADELVLQTPLPAPGALLHVGRARLDRLAAQAPAWDAVLKELSAGPYVDVGRLLGA